MQFILSMLNHALQYRRLALRYMSLYQRLLEMVASDSDVDMSHQHQEQMEMVSQVEEMHVAMRERMRQFSQSNKLVFLVLKKLENSGTIGMKRVFFLALLCL
jgi:hypothetical protein